MGTGRTILVAASAAILLGACGQVAPPRVRPAPGSLVAAPVPGGPLQSIDCVSASTCWAVGSNGASPSRAQAVIERYSARGWGMAMSEPPPVAHGYALNGVACASSVDCWAVGTDSGPGGGRPLIEHYTGGAWSMATAAPDADTTPAELRAVACVAVADCWAVGATGSSPERPLVEHFDGNRWTVAPPPVVPATGDASLSAVTCLQDGSCWTVGAADVQHPLVARLDGASWVAVTTPAIGADESASLSGVSCTRALECWAVGSVSAGGKRWPLIEGNDGSGWAVDQTPRPLLSSGGWLSGVTCKRAQECWAAGEVLSLSGAEQPFVQRYDGSVWSAVRPPPHAAAALVASVACSDEDDCWTVGSCTPSHSAGCGGSASLIEMYDTILPDGH